MLLKEKKHKQNPKMPNVEYYDFGNYKGEAAEKYVPQALLQK